VLELMSPSQGHERVSSYLGRLIEIYADHEDIELSPYRSWTLKRRPKAGAEPDECYMFGPAQDKKRPDLVIEVIWKRGGIDKLEIYRHLGIGEVWFWHEQRGLEIYSLRRRRYRRIARSRWLPGLDLELMCSFLDRRSVSIAKRDFRAALQASSRQGPVESRRSSKSKRAAKPR
jgi:Uma2 family endonuclease